MHQDWNFNTTKAQKRGAYRNITEVIQTIRDISPESGAYFVSGYLVLCSRGGSDLTKPE